MAIEYHIAAFNFYPGSNGLLNGNMEANSYWSGSGSQSSYWYSNSLSYFGSRSLAFQISGGSPASPTEIRSYYQSKAYDVNSYGCNRIFDGLYPDDQVQNQWLCSFPSSSLDIADWFQIGLVSPKQFSRMRMMASNNAFNIAVKYYPVSIRIKGSMTGSYSGEESTLYSHTNTLSWTKGEWKTFSLSSVGTYTFYRVLGAPAYGIGWMIIAEAEFYEW
jgi:hypothetical protein